MKKAGMVLGLLVVLIMGGGVWFLASDTGKGLQIGVNYTARSLCSCVFVQGRDIAACYGDMIGAVEQIPVKIDREAEVVRTSIFGVLKGSAVHVEGRGCYLD